MLAKPQSNSLTTNNNKKRVSYNAYIQVRVRTTTYTKLVVQRLERRVICRLVNVDLVIVCIK